MGADDELYAEVIATLEGAKGLIRPTKRDTDELGPNSKGVLASRLESEIATFDQRQKKAALRPLDGPQRVRGLAGSGKTVVLAMKAALIHLRDPEAAILYAFWTKSLYQHVRRLITRFYRQFEDRDPDWNRLRVMHGWGGASLEGVYSTAAVAAGIKPLTFQEASLLNRISPFEAACEQLLKQPIKPLYDYVLIDEGQDYPPNFIKLCARLAVDDRFVIAYDELQNIFQTKLPTAQDILGGEKNEFAEDLVLHKCYRNPREVLVCAHAVGFGLYTDHIVQMLENKEHWEDIGYKVIQGSFTEGSETIIERPHENSLKSVSSNQSFDEIVSLKAVSSLEEEVKWVVESILSDISDGLRPEDILVITVDDRNAKTYLNTVSVALHGKNIASLNVHAPFGDSDFQREGSVTLSTVHKAKGNEAMTVYVVGADALYPRPSIRQRNMLFASMTRAKAWLRVSGVSPAMDSLIQEINEAKERFPKLIFKYPSPAQLKVMRRDLEDSASKRLAAERVLEEVSGSMSEEEFEAVLQRFRTRAAKGGKPKSSKRNEP